MADTTMVRDRAEATIRRIDQSAQQQQPMQNQVQQQFSTITREIAELQAYAKTFSERVERLSSDWNQVQQQVQTQTQNSSPELLQVVREVAQTVRDLAQQYDPQQSQPQK